LRSNLLSSNPIDLSWRVTYPRKQPEKRASLQNDPLRSLASMYLKGSTMNIDKFRVSRVGYLILLPLALCTPALAQHASGLGGSFNDPAGGMITKTIVDRVARRRRDKPRTIPAGTGAPVRCRSTGTQRTTRETAHAIHEG